MRRSKRRVRANRVAASRRGREVRNLAQRSAAAAKEIKTLIGDSVEKVEGAASWWHRPAKR